MEQWRAYEELSSVDSHHRRSPSLSPPLPGDMPKNTLLDVADDGGWLASGGAGTRAARTSHVIYDRLCTIWGLGRNDEEVVKMGQNAKNSCNFQRFASIAKVYTFPVHAPHSRASVFTAFVLDLGFPRRI